jgi:NAD(P)-dependent dehydrogenase (short-subunit alcohol dehydrogenase family)
MPTVLITGANRGIGLEHARAYAAAGWQVLACARDPEASPALQELAEQHGSTVRPLKLDVTHHAGVEALAGELKDTTIDVLLNNAGTFGPAGAPEGMSYQSLTNMDYQIWRQILEVNLLSPFKVAVAFCENLRRSDRPLLVMMSSDLGAISQNTQGGSYSYRSSKAALNMVSKGMALEWPDIIVIAMAPGWCKTDLGGDIAPIDPVDSVRDQQQAFEQLTLEQSGCFIDRFGEEVAW